MDREKWKYINPAEKYKGKKENQKGLWPDLINTVKFGYTSTQFIKHAVDKAFQAFGHTNC